MTNSNGLTRRVLVRAGAGALGAAALGPAASAADYPTRPVDMIIPFPPGGGSDVFARIAAKGLETALGQPVIPINRPGAGAMIGTNAAKNARPDGYTLLWVSISFLVNPIIRPVGYDPVKDFAPIGMVARATYVLVANPKRGFNSAADLIAYAKANPNGLKFGSPGIGVSGQLAGDLLRHLAGIKFVDVRYKGSSEAVLATMSGETDFCFESPAAVLPNVKTGRLSLLAGAGETRDPIYPDLPTIAEVLPGYAVWPWFGIVGPAGLPEPTRAVLGAALSAMAGDAVLKQRLTAAGVEAFNMDAQHFVDFLATDRNRWTDIAAREPV